MSTATLARPVAAPAASDEGAPLLEIDGVRLRYGAADVLRGVSLSVRSGEIAAVIGRNGVGKTSLVRAVAGQHPIAGGAIRLDGRALGRDAPYARARAGLGLVPQGREIFPLLTVAENLRTGAAALPRGADRSVPDEVNELFPVLATMAGRRGGDLSGGQQQQLAIGRALVARPRVLVLDEPTEGIQPSIIKDIGRALELLAARGLAILLVEQYLDFVAEHAGRVHVMERGAIVHEGPPAILADPEVRARLTV